MHISVVLFIDLDEGIWSHWGAWGRCSLTCASGTKSRVRYCTGNDQIHGGLFCPGDHFETATCNTQACPRMTLKYLVH